MKTIEYNLILFISQIMKLFYLYFVMGQIVVEYLKPLAVENNFAFLRHSIAVCPKSLSVKSLLKLLLPLAYACNSREKFEKSNCCNNHLNSVLEMTSKSSFSTSSSVRVSKPSPLYPLVMACFML